MEGHWGNELHAMGYLVYAHLQKGDNKRANEQYEYLKTIKKLNPSNAAAIAYPFAAIPTRIALENKDWKAAANLTFHESELPWEDYPWQKSLLHFGKAIGSAHLGDLNAANKEIEILEGLRRKNIEKGNAASAKHVMVEIKIAKGLLLFLNKEKMKGIALLKEAVVMEDDLGKHGITPGKITPAREFLADILMSMNKPNDALVIYEKNLTINPNRFNGVYGVAKAAAISGNNEKAAKYYKQLIKLTENISSNRPELEEAQIFLKNNDLSI